MKVWVLTQGEDCEGGFVLRVYATAELAHADFMEAVRGMYRSVDDAKRNEDGSLYAHAGCDRICLDPYDVVEQAAITA